MRHWFGQFYFKERMTFRGNKIEPPTNTWNNFYYKTRNCGKVVKLRSEEEIAEVAKLSRQRIDEIIFATKQEITQKYQNPPTSFQPYTLLQFGAVIIKIRAERRAGEILKEMEKAKGTKGQLVGKDSSGGCIVQPPEEIPTYKITIRALVA
jgi:hypothetical protein